MIAIVDLGYGNLGSVAIAFERLGLPMTISADPAVIAAASHVVLPGVGAAGYAMRRIDELGLRAPMLALAQPVLGICVGMQLLFERSEEDGGTDCLGIIPGSVRKLEPEPGRPVPHMGWARLQISGDALGLAEGDYVYFANSFAADPGPHVVASTTYGREIPAVVAWRNFAGVQFHPERSSAAGSRLLRRFVGLP
jgi:glutamine amidotransferase